MKKLTKALFSFLLLWLSKSSLSSALRFLSLLSSFSSFSPVSLSFSLNPLFLSSSVVYSDFLVSSVSSSVCFNKSSSWKHLNVPISVIFFYVQDEEDEIKLMFFQQSFTKRYKIEADTEIKELRSYYQKKSVKSETNKWTIIIKVKVVFWSHQGLYIIKDDHQYEPLNADVFPCIFN